MYKNLISLKHSKFNIFKIIEISMRLYFNNLKIYYIFYFFMKFLRAWQACVTYVNPCLLKLFHSLSINLFIFLIFNYF